MSFWNNKKILVTGGFGFLGSFVVENLINNNKAEAENIIIPSSKECDLRLVDNCKKIIKNVDIVIHIAGRTGGIGFNKQFPGSLFYDNLVMNTHLMETSRQEGVEKFVGIGTVCSYPKYTGVPFKEEDLWNGYPEETNAPYGLAKKMMLVQSQAYRQQYEFNSIHLLMINLYGPRDKFDEESSHVIPALIKKFMAAKRSGAEAVTAWGSGSASREFLYVKDAAEGIILATEKYNKDNPVNLGSGHEVKIKDLVETIAELTEFHGEIIWDSTKPDGQPRRCLNVTKAEEEFGFKAKTSLKDGLKYTIDWYQKKICDLGRS